MVLLSRNKSDQNRTSGWKGSGDVYGSSATWLMHTGDSTCILGQGPYQKGVDCPGYTPQSILGL